MDFSTINWAAFAVVYVIGFMIGAIWFGPKTFYPTWWKLMGDRPMPSRENPTAPAAALFSLTMAGLFVQVLAVALLVPTIGMWSGVFVGLAAAAASLGHRMFGGHGVKVWLIEVTPDIIVAVLAGVVFTLWK